MIKTVGLIAGPTASGKSALALEMADRLDGVIVNADSMQVYRELEILSARPSAAELAGAPHRLYGVLPLADPCSAARWRGMALEVIEAVHAEGKTPILVGGTGLYIKALIEGLAPIPDVPVDIRRTMIARREEIGGQAFHDELAAMDPAMAARLDPGDSQRVIRAREVIEATGRSLAYWTALPLKGPPSDLAFEISVVLPDRAWIYHRIEDRFDAMMAAGALDEARAIAALGLDPELPGMKAVGLPPLLAHLRGECTVEAAVALAKQHSRNYAKRQFTWFRHQLPEGHFRSRVHVCHASGAQHSRHIGGEFWNKIRETR